MRVLYAVLMLILSSASAAVAQDAVFLIRHGEKELSGDDPSLTPKGRKRAAAWAEMLRPVGLDGVVTSDALRTQETGGIIADALGLQVLALPRSDITGLIDALEFDFEDGTVLVVAHAETIPRILEYFGVLEAVTIDQSEFAKL